MSSFLHRIGRFAARHPWRVIGLWAVSAVVVVLVSAVGGKDLEDTFEVPGLDSQTATDLLQESGSSEGGLLARVVATPTAGGTFTDPANAGALDELVAELDRLDHVLASTEAISPAGTVALVQLQYPVIDDLSRADLEALHEAVDANRGGPLTVEMGGDLLFAFEEADSGTGELLGLGVAVVVLLVAFGSLVAMGLPLLVALGGLAVGASLVPLIAHLVAIPSWAPQIATMVGLGVGIDYALFLVTRHREHLAAGMAVDEAAGRANATAGTAVLFAGGTVVIAILGLGFAGIPFVTAAGISMSVVVAVMVLASLTLLPALLGLVGARVDGSMRRRRTKDQPAGGRGAGEISPTWNRWGRHVSRHAWPYAIGVTALLLALAAPVFALELGFPDDGVQPESTSQRRAYDLVAEGFGPGANGPLVIAVDLDGADEAPGRLAARAEVERLAAAVDADPGIATVSPAQIDIDAGVGSFTALPTTEPRDQVTYETIERLRAEVFPTTLAGTGATAHVGGVSANFGDIGAKITDRLPLLIGAVIALSLVLLTAVFRSVVVAAKAAVLNLLSIGAAYGVLVAVFQWGWGASLIGLETTVPIVAFIPMFMFAILFGLSMDYEVFLLSRVREHYVASGDNDGAVIAGLASTARVITSAALIMISVFSGFVLGTDPTVKMMGLGLATAILVDATIVRLVLVPAAMSLMGDRNWWLPDWLDRRLPTIDLDGGLAEPPVAPESDERPELVGV